MKSNAGRLRRRLHRCLATALICSAIVLCHSCTQPDEALAANMDNAGSSGQVTVEGPVFLEKEEIVKPDLILKQGSATYQLISAELTEVVVEGELTYVAASIPYELEGQQSPPETTVITLYDEQTKSEYKRELSCQEIKETEVLWEETFSFPITVSGYDAEHFQLGNTLIPKGEELIAYADQILDSIGLSEDYYHIKTIAWSGDAYEREGKVFRDAIAEGEKRIRRVDVKYGGEIKTPDTIGYQYISVYEIPKEKEEIKKDNLLPDTKERLDELHTSEQRVGLAERIQQFLQEHMTVVTISAGFILLLIGGVYILWESKKSTKKQKSKELS